MYYIKFVKFGFSRLVDGFSRLVEGTYWERHLVVAIGYVLIRSLAMSRSFSSQEIHVAARNYRRLQAGYVWGK